MWRWWLSVLGTGYSPIIPGTCGSAVVLVVFLLAALPGGSPPLVTGIMLVVAVHGFWATVVYGDRFIAKYGPDPGVIVSDEQCGQAITYLCYFWMPLATHSTKEIIFFALTGFVLFRMFDVIKPPPVRMLEKVKGPWGVLLDDIMAGIYANIALQIVWHLDLLYFLFD